MSTDQRALFAEFTDIIRRDRARRSRWRKFGSFLGKVFEAAVTSLLSSMLGGWTLMLAVAVAHDHWIPQLPTIGYWWAVLLFFLLPTPAAPSSKKAAS